MQLDVGVSPPSDSIKIILPKFQLTTSFLDTSAASCVLKGSDWIRLFFFAPPFRLNSGAPIAQDLQTSFQIARIKYLLI